MNGSYYNNPVYPADSYPNYEGTKVNIPENNQIPLTMEQSYIENILRLNKGRHAIVYASFPDSNEWKDRKFEGIIEQAGRDHVIIRDPSTNEWYMILMIYLDYVKFFDKINYGK